VLLDEVEKAHSDVLNILLQVMEDGILTDGKGRTVSFKNAILVLTSNIGSRRILDLSKTHDGRPEYSKLVVAVKGELEASMKPELLNRIDEIVVFEPLSDDQLTLIAAMMILDITVRSQMERNIEIGVTRALTKRIVAEGSKSAGQFGARPMRRAVQRIVEDSISDAIVQGYLVDDDSAVFDLLEGAVNGNGSYQVLVTRSRDDVKLYIEVEESSRDTLVNQSDAIIEDEITLDEEVNAAKVVNANW
jgi:ATP-dependent Clp protease ATP-binding subunit ClpC